MADPTVAGSVGELLQLIESSARIDGERLEITDAAAFRADTVATLAWSQTFTEDATVADAARWIVWEASQQLGCPSASIHDLYMARGRGEVGGFTVPAVNVRTQVFDMAATMFRAARSVDAGAIIQELARSEQEYSYQRQGEFITNVLAGAIRAGWERPVFVQGDHYQFNAKKYRDDPQGITENIKGACTEALRVGYGNIDIDSSTLVDLSLPAVEEQQRVNFERAAEVAAHIREVEPDGLVVSIGGEIGEVGKQNSTEEELRVYLAGFRRELDRRAGTGATGLSKVSVQTGTTHGGVPLPGGGVADVKVDFDTIERLSAVCREHGLAGVVQHGASTLPDELFHRFPQVETAEIHLATGFINLLLDHAAFPAELLERMEQWCFGNTTDERKDDETDAQFVYKTRKKALGPFKRELWELPARDAILADQERKFRFLFEQLGVAGTRDAVERYVSAPERTRPLPDVLRATAPATR